MFLLWLAAARGQQEEHLARLQRQLKRTLARMEEKSGLNWSKLVCAAGFGCVLTSVLLQKDLMEALKSSLQTHFSLEMFHLLLLLLLYDSVSPS